MQKVIKKLHINCHSEGALRLSSEQAPRPKNLKNEILRPRKSARPQNDGMLSQTFLEYAVVILVAAIALFAMRVYFVRAVQQKYRQSADVFGEGGQYVPGKTQVNESYTSSVPSEPPALPTEGTCANIVARVNALADAINGYDSPVGCKAPDCVHTDGYLDMAAKAEARATEIEAQIAVLTQKGLTQQAASLTESARISREQAAYFTAQAQIKQAQIDQLKLDRPECF